MSRLWFGKTIPHADQRPGYRQILPASPKTATHSEQKFGYIPLPVCNIRKYTRYGDSSPPCLLYYILVCPPIAASTPSSWNGHRAQSVRSWHLPSTSCIG